MLSKSCDLSGVPPPNTSSEIFSVGEASALHRRCEKVEKRGRGEAEVKENGMRQGAGVRESMSVSV